MSTCCPQSPLAELSAEFVFQQFAHLFVSGAYFVISEGATISAVNHSKSKRPHSLRNSLPRVHVEQSDTVDLVDTEARDGALDIAPQDRVRYQRRNVPRRRRQPGYRTVSRAPHF